MSVASTPCDPTTHHSGRMMKDVPYSRSAVSMTDADCRREGEKTPVGIRRKTVRILQQRALLETYKEEPQPNKKGQNQNPRFVKNRTRTQNLKKMCKGVSHVRIPTGLGPNAPAIFRTPAESDRQKNLRARFPMGLAA